jgi:NAD(P)-dependent dehydrogenase (short-subunit alcohol dehydrogenase family)
MCLINQQDVQGTPLAEMAVEDLMRPVDVTTRGMFVTARAAARHMIRQGSGVILAFGGYGDPWPNLGGLQVAFGAAEALRRSLAVELGPHGVRVVTLQTNGILETIPDDFERKAEISDAIIATTMLKRGATLEDVGNAAVFAASDWGRTVTASKINITCGGEVD